MSVSTVGLARQPAWPRTPGALKRVSSRNRTHGGVSAHARAGILCRNGAAARSARLIETRWMRYVKVTDDGSGGSRFEDAEAVSFSSPISPNFQATPIGKKKIAKFRALRLLFPLPGERARVRASFYPVFPEWGPLQILAEIPCVRARMGEHSRSR